MMKHFFLGIMCLVPMIAGAVVKEDQPVAVNSSTSGDASPAPSSGLASRSASTTLTFRIYNTCYGTNLRGTSSPLASDATLKATLKVRFDTGVQTFVIKYPTNIVSNEGMTETTVQPIDPSNYTLPGGGSAALFGNVVEMRVPATITATVDESGNITETDPSKDVSIESTSFEQENIDCSNPTPVYGGYGYSSYTPTHACGEFMGTNGPVTATIGGFAVSSDRRNIELHAAFPGQTGFCGSYWSPLMMFFDEGRPSFKNTSEFPLNPYGKTYWPEKGAPGYFLVIDKNKDGKITRADELFGDQGDLKTNGFKRLAEYDSNHDGVIDKKDKYFSKLKLWRDENGDGVSQPSELFTLKQMKVESLSLAYDPKYLHPIGEQAQERERSTFTFRKNGKRVKGTLVDVWFSPAPNKMAQDAKVNPGKN